MLLFEADHYNYVACVCVPCGAFGRFVLMYALLSNSEVVEVLPNGHVNDTLGAADGGVLTHLTETTQAPFNCL